LWLIATLPRPQTYSKRLLIFTAPRGGAQKDVTEPASNRITITGRPSLDDMRIHFDRSPGGEPHGSAFAVDLAECGNDI